MDPFYFIALNQLILIVNQFFNIPAIQFVYEDVKIGGYNYSATAQWISQLTLQLISVLTSAYSVVNLPLRVSTDLKFNSLIDEPFSLIFKKFWNSIGIFSRKYESEIDFLIVRNTRPRIKNECWRKFAEKLHFGAFDWTKLRSHFDMNIILTYLSEKRFAAS